MSPPSPAGEWLKQGLVFAVDGQGGWINSHAQVPTALLQDDRIRVFISTRPVGGRSELGYVDLDRGNPLRVIGVSPAPIMALGGPGSFDEHGVMPSSVIETAQGLRLYYSGWSRLSGAAPYHNTTGLAISEDGGKTFRREVPGPVLDRSPYEPFSATSPHVLRAQGRWHVFYSSGLGWLDIDGKCEHVYDLRHATSADGVDWRRGGHPAIAQAFPTEAITRPTIVADGADAWSMWFCHRGSADFRAEGEAYRIGYATSADLETWQRQDAGSGISVSSEGWDSKMIAYPCVIEDEGRRMMFYNGDGFGEAGFGLAIWHG